MAGRQCNCPFVLAVALVVGAAACRDEAPRPPAGMQRPARAANGPEGPKKAAIDSEGRLVVEIRADDTVALHADGVVLGTYSDGPSLRAALEEIAMTRPELAKYAAIKLPLVFGDEAPKEFWEAMDAAGYRHVFGARLIRGGANRARGPGPSGPVSPKKANP